MGSYKAHKSLQARLMESQQIRDKYPDRVCVICEKSANGGHIANLDKIKYLVPGTLSLGQCMFIIRKRLKLESPQSMFFFVGGRSIPTPSVDMTTLYRDHKDEDGLLYIVYATENTFGRNCN